MRVHDALHNLLFDALTGLRREAHAPSRALDETLTATLRDLHRAEPLSAEELVRLKTEAVRLYSMAFHHGVYNVGRFERLPRKRGFPITYRFFCGTCDASFVVVRNGFTALVCKGCKEQIRVAPLKPLTNRGSVYARVSARDLERMDQALYEALGRLSESVRHLLRLHETRSLTVDEQLVLDAARDAAVVFDASARVDVGMLDAFLADRPATPNDRTLGE